MRGMTCVCDEVRYLGRGGYWGLHGDFETYARILDVDVGITSVQNRIPMYTFWAYIALFCVNIYIVRQECLVDWEVSNYQNGTGHDSHLHSCKYIYACAESSRRGEDRTGWAHACIPFVQLDAILKLADGHVGASYKVVPSYVVLRVCMLCHLHTCTCTCVGYAQHVHV